MACVSTRGGVDLVMSRWLTTYTLRPSDQESKNTLTLILHTLQLRFSTSILLDALYFGLGTRINLCCLGSQIQWEIISFRQHRVSVTGHGIRVCIVVSPHTQASYGVPLENSRATILLDRSPY